MSSYRVADLQAMASNRALSQQARAGCAAVAAAMEALSSVELVGYRVAFNVRADGASFCEIYPPATATTPAPAPKQAPAAPKTYAHVKADYVKAHPVAPPAPKQAAAPKQAPAPVAAPVVVVKKAAFVHTDATVHGRDGGDCIQIVSIVNPERARRAFGKAVKVGMLYEFDSSARAGVLSGLGRAVTEPNLRSLSRILYGAVTYTSVKRS